MKFVVSFILTIFIVKPVTASSSTSTTTNDIVNNDNIPTVVEQYNHTSFINKKILNKTSSSLSLDQQGGQEQCNVTNEIEEDCGRSNSDDTTTATTTLNENNEDDENNDENNSNNLLKWYGIWKFEESWFRKQHRWVPKFVINKALKYMLILNKDELTYHQIDENGNPLMGLKKRIIKIISITPTKVHLQRIENDNKSTIIDFFVEKRKKDNANTNNNDDAEANYDDDDPYHDLFYVEGSQIYRLLPGTLS